MTGVGGVPRGCWQFTCPGCGWTTMDPDAVPSHFVAGDACIEKWEAAEYWEGVWPEEETTC